MSNTKKSLKKVRLLALAMVTLLALTAFWGCSSPTPTETTVGETGGTSAQGSEETTLAAGNLFTPGTYTGTAKGFGGEVTATVVLSADKIESVTVVGDLETEGIGSVAIEQLPAIIEERQTTNIDAVASASVSSKAVIEAVNAALESAGVDPSSLKGIDSQAVEKTQEVIEVDVVVVGAGGAGMTSAITIKQAGYNVIIVEKMPMVGGNTLKATGGMNAAETRLQASEGVEDSVQTFIDDTMEGGHNLNNLELVTMLAENSSDAIDWLETIGAPLTKLSFSGGATNKRIHAPEDGSAVGAYLVDIFKDNLAELGIDVYLNTEATEFIQEDGKVTGVLANSSEKEYTIKADAVVLATGGFGANEEMYTGYREDLKGYVTTNTPGATGDGLIMAEAVGADFVDLEQIQIHPTVHQETSIMITESVRGGGAILVNQSGERFTDELLTRDVVSAAVNEQEDSYAYLIFDQQLRDNLAAVEKYVSNNIVMEAATIKELASQIGVDPAVLEETLTVWNQAVADQNDTAFGRDTGMEADISVAPYYAIKIAPGIHHTMGGVKINTNAEVISTTGEIIPGLFAAGEVTGGVHGGNRIGGNAVADIVVFGRISGASAIEYIEKQE